MKHDAILIRGTVWVSLEAAAACYRVEVTWLEEVYAVGLLGPGEAVEGALAIEAAMLDRLGQIVRLYRQQGINIEGIARLLK